MIKFEFIQRAFSLVQVLRHLATSIFLFCFTSQSGVAEEFAYSKAEDQIYPKVWARAGIGGGDLNSIVSWTKKGRAVLYDPHEVLINACGGYYFCGTLFFNGKHLPKGMWHDLDGIGTDFKRYRQVDLPDGSSLKISMLRGALTTNSNEGVMLKDGSKVRIRFPAPFSQYPDFDCQYQNFGITSYFEKISPEGQQVWAKYVFVSPSRKTLYKETDKRSVMYDESFRVAAQREFFISTDEKDIFFSDFRNTIVRVDARSGEMGKPLPNSLLVKVDSYWGLNIGKNFVVKIVDAENVMAFFRELVYVLHHESWEEVHSIVPYDNAGCPPVLNDQIYKRYFKGE